jgi:hypothetical protein
MSIGVEFVLRAKSSSFTQGLASANNAIKDLKKSAREFDIGNGLKQALGVGGIIAGFRAAITNAQELRDEAQKTGRAIDDSVRSVAEYGDALDKTWVGMKNLATTTLSFFTRAGEGWGMLINRMRGVSAEQEKIAENAAKAADAAEANLAKSKIENDPKKVAEIREKSADLSSRQDRGTRLAFLIEQEKKLRSEMGKTGEQTAKYAQLEQDLAQTTIEKKKLLLEIEKEGNKIQEGFQKEEEKEHEKRIKSEKELINKFAPTVEELAKTETGGFVAGNDPRLQARKIIGLEERAQTLFGRGDYKGGLAAAAQAQQMRQNLEGQTSGTGPLTPKAAEDAFTNALKTTNAKIEDLEKAIGGIIKAQP